MKYIWHNVVALSLIACSGWSQSVEDSLILIDRIDLFYDVDEYRLSVRNESLLKSFFEYQNTDELEFHIDSYTDADGSIAYNEGLSIRRSEAILDWLLNQGVSQDRIWQKGHGEFYSNDTESANDKSRQRRSELRVYQKTPFKVFKGVIKSDNADELEGLEISVNDNGIKRRVIIDQGIEFSVSIPIHRQVKLQFEAKDHFPVVRTLRLSPRAKVDNVIIPIVRMKANAVVNLDVQFFGGRSIIIPSYMASLGTLASVMSKSTKICLELAGHINQPGDIIDDRMHRSYGLSIARAIVIHDYLTESGIDKNRLLARGYSNSQMKYPNATSEEQASANRRVEARVISCDSTRIIPNDFFKDIGQFRPIE